MVEAVLAGARAYASHEFFCSCTPILLHALLFAAVYLSADSGCGQESTPVADTASASTSCDGWLGQEPKPFTAVVPSFPLGAHHARHAVIGVIYIEYHGRAVYEGE